MILSTFRTRVRDRLRATGAGGSTSYSNALIDATLDEVIEIHREQIAKSVPEFYQAIQSYTGVDDAESGSGDERYALPSDFSVRIFLRRTDIEGRPNLAFISYEDIDNFRIYLNKPYSDLDGLSSSFSGQAQCWTLYDSDSLAIIPAPESNAFTYELAYWRTHVTAAADGDTVDVPDKALPFIIRMVAASLLMESQGESAAQGLQRSAAQALQGLEHKNPAYFQGVVPPARRWWP